MNSLEVNGGRIHVDDSGGDGPPVLFLHGFLFDGRMFDGQVRALAGRYRCLRLDLPGQGRSARAAHSYQLEQLTADVRAVLRQLHLPSVHLVGLSMGGYLAMRLAARTPDVVRSLTLLNTGAGAHPRRKLPEHLGLAGMARVLGPGSPAVAAGLERSLYAEAFRRDAGSGPVRAAWRDRWRASDVSPLIRTILGLMVRPGLEAELPSIPAPTLVIAGEQDTQHPPGDGRRIAAGIPGARFVELPGVGHSAPLEDPASVTRELRRFLDEIEVAGQR